MHIDSKKFIPILLVTIFPLLSSCASSCAAAGDRYDQDVSGRSGSCQVHYHDDLNGFGCGVGLISIAENAGDQSIIRMYLRDGRRIDVDRSYEFNPEILHFIASALNYLLELKSIEGDDPGFPVPISQIIRESDSLLVSEFDRAMSITLKAASFSLVVVGGSGGNGFSYKYIIH